MGWVVMPVASMVDCVASAGTLQSGNRHYSRTASELLSECAGHVLSFVFPSKPSHERMPMESQVGDCDPQGSGKTQNAGFAGRSSIKGVSWERARRPEVEARECLQRQ